MPTSSRSSTLTRAILIAGLVAGTLDILDAILFYGLRGVSPIRILQSVAAGLLGRASFAGGWKTAALGLALHFLIALIWATLFVVAAQRLPFLFRRAILSGLLYGAFVYLVMNFVVLPLSRAAPQSSYRPGIPLLNAILAVVLLIGLPIALLNRRLAPPPVSS